MMIHKIFLSLDNNYWLKLLEFYPNEPTNQNLIKFPKVVEPTNKKTIKILELAVVGIYIVMKDFYSSLGGGGGLRIIFDNKIIII